MSEEGLLSENGAYSAKKKYFYSNQPALDAILSLEGGIRWKLRDGLGLYTGLYFDFGLVRPHQVVDTDHLTNKVLNFDPDNIKYGREYPTVATDNATTHSVVEAVAPDYFYGKDPSPVATEPGTTAVDGVHFIDNPDPFAKTLNRMQAGIKVRFAFGRIKARQKVVRTPKVKPEPAKPTEVPQEIKQTMIELSDALFAFDKFDLNEEARALLDKVTDWLKENPDLKVEIAGHTDSRGSDAYNQKLSENRAKAVYDYLTSHGISKSRLSYKGYGESQPIATNETDEGRQKNRRVELHIIQQESGTE